MFYTLTEMFSNLPSVIILQYIANLDKIVDDWDKVEANHRKKPIFVPPAATGSKSEDSSSSKP